MAEVPEDSQVPKHCPYKLRNSHSHKKKVSIEHLLQ